ncbi:hypothetical protein C2845_PM07G29830 [Panicum miliaceum]|uniref:Uncharacterized protein n=1 Tax=Panicum miliaceum TaxID=4540 RepID=A0A3L6SLY6_PANMI|nr:hypothetical protein C2845_PM07G29830 [Panicum miliaceum]
MRERADELKGKVRQMFGADRATSVAAMVDLVDELERLGVDNHFREEINAALSRIHSEGLDAGMSSNLHAVALRFCLLRQHGFWVSADVFDKFRDETGSFGEDLRSDSRGLLSLYNAAHMAVPGEATLDDAIAFARRHLEAAVGKLGSPMAAQVSRALEIPRPRFMRRLETLHYIIEYEQEEAHDATLLELARLGFNLLRSLHLKELRTLSLWWRDLYSDVELTYARDRIVEPYFYNFGAFHEEENSHIRMIVTKVFALIGLMDDTYDVRATMEECQMLDEAIQRHVFKSQSKYYLQETKWFDENHVPGFKEHVDVTLMSTGVAFLFFVALMAAGQVVSKEAFEWAYSVPDMVRASGEMGRFLNDIASYKRRKNMKDVASTVECYMKEHGATGEEAVMAIGRMVEQAWRRINRAYMEMDRTVEPAARLLLGMTRMLEIYYLHGRDGLKYGRDIKELVAFLFLEQVPL